MKQLLFTKGPQGPIGATLVTAMNNFCSSSNKVSTHYITWLFSFWIWRRRCLKFAWFWPFGALPLGPHGGHTYYLNNFESPTPKDDSCQVWLKSNHAFSRRRWKCKKFTDDGRRTTDDGRKRTAIAHSSLRLRWAKNSIVTMHTCKFVNTTEAYHSHFPNYYKLHWGHSDFHWITNTECIISFKSFYVLLNYQQGNPKSQFNHQFDLLVHFAHFLYMYVCPHSTSSGNHGDVIGTGTRTFREAHVFLHAQLHIVLTST